MTTTSSCQNPSALVQSEPPTLRLGAVFVLVVWLACLAIGGIGWWVRYPAVSRPRPNLETMLVERLEVDLAPAPASVSPASSQAIPDPAAPPPSPDLVQPDLPAPVAVASPTPSIAFAVPVEGPVTLVEPAQATYTTPVKERNPAPATTSPTVGAQPETLTYGTGEGRQPAPEYPRRAIREGQEGTVVVRFVVGAEGRVVSAEAHASSSWPLLDEAAVRAVRERWRFKAGRSRAYEVSIRFELKK